jgi:hypothetical protein
MEIGWCLPCNVQEASCIGEGPEYKPFRDLRSVFKAGRQVRELKIQRKIQAMVSKAGRQVRELKRQRKNPGNAFRVG